MVEKHLLLTVGEQQSAMHGIRFLGRFFSNKEGIKFTLFYTAPRPPAVWEGERTAESAVQAEQQARKIEARGRKALDSAGKELTSLGFEPENIATQIKARRFSKIMDIIQEGEEGLYDAVVLGRRGLSWLEEAFDESVSKGLLEQKVTFPIWLCRRPELKRKDVLVCVDGSDAAHRIVDHVGFILGQERKHEVTLLYVRKATGRSGEKYEAILSKCKEELLSHGLSEEMIRVKVVESGSPAKAILKEAEQGKFAAVAVGRTGKGQRLLEKFFLGSVSFKLFRELERSALWVCY